jgi:hypothetical protein
MVLQDYRGEAQLTPPALVADVAATIAQDHRPMSVCLVIPA